VLVLVLAVSVVLAAAQSCDKSDPVEPTPETAIRGKITHTYTGAPIDSAEVWISPPGTTMVYTNTRGEYAFTRLSPGTYELHVMKSFYEIKSRAVVVRNERTTGVNFTIDDIVDDSQFDFWGKFRWHHYYVSKTAWTWNNARLISLAQNGYMVTIADASEDSLVLEIANSCNAHMAIGFTDEVVEGAWVWVTGEPVTYMYWAPGEPNNSNNEDYAMLFVTYGYWNDYAGTVPTRFVLEVE